MRIIHIINNLYAGGAQTFVVLLAVEQSKLGHNVSIIIIDELTGSSFEKSLLTKLSSNKINVVSSKRRIGKNLSIVKSVSSIYNLIIKESPDVVNTHLAFSHLVAGFALKLTSLFSSKKVEHIITIHNAPEVWNKTTLLLNKTRSSIYCSKAAIDTGIKRACKKIVIENGIEKPFLNDSAEKIIKELNIKPSSKLVLCVGKLSTQKNYELVVQIAKQHINDDINFLICGLPGNTYEQDIANFSSVPNIHYLGIRTPEEIHSLMNKCDCFLNTSIFEGLPITILEAFFIGTPCLLSPIPPHYEIGTSMPYCYLSKSFTPEAFSDKLKEIFTLTVHKQTVLQEREVALKKFEIQNTAKAYIKFYQENLSPLS